jgi:hypothetical protein
MRKSTLEEFIKKAKEIHGDKYDYSLVEYINCESEVKIYCKECKEYFYQNPYQHIIGKGCRICIYKYNGIEKRSNTKEFIKKAKEIHGDKYDYSLVEYTRNNKNVKIYCNECKEYFYQSPMNTLQGKGCQKCAYNMTGDKLRMSIEDFIKKAKEIHGDKYDYSLVEYINCESKVKIYCKECKEYFWQRAASHTLQKCGCPKCAKYGIGDKELAELYIIYDKKYNLYKIGNAKNSYQRYLKLNRIHNYNLQLIKSIPNFGDREKEIHKILKDYRVNHPEKRDGYTEWFNCDLETILQSINKIENQSQ